MIIIESKLLLRLILIILLFSLISVFKIKIFWV